jgi:hypothetical protein
MNAFHYCIALLATGNDSCNADWSETIAKLTAGYRDQIILDKVVSLEEREDGASYVVKTPNMQVCARRAVISTPASATPEFFGVPSAIENNPSHVFHVRGRRKKLYRPRRSLLMRPDDEIGLFFPQPDGIEIVYSRRAEPDFKRFYDEFEVIDHRFWKTAIQLSKEQWRPLQPRRNLFTIGDYNICGLEDSYLTGLFAANKIIDAG